MYKLYDKKDGNLKVYVGTIVSVNIDTQADIKRIQVMLKDYNDNEMAFFFENDSKFKKADIVERMNLKQKDFVAIIAKCSDETKGTATGSLVLRNGRTSIGEYNIYVGVANVNEFNSRSDVFSLTIPINDYNENGRVVNWHQINFWNNEKKNRADMAKKIIGSNKSCRVAVLTGKIIEKNKNSKCYYNTSGFSLVRCSDIVEEK